jgi:ATP/ADP translocase
LDSERAVLVGRFFASVNIAACFLQVFVMPSVLSVSTLPQVICSIPIVILVIVIGGYIYPSLLTVMFGFGALKVLEYSIMTSATEMIYMPMNSEQRYLGKELIRFFGHRMGKSAAVMILSAASAHFRPSLATQVTSSTMCSHMHLLP